MAFSVRARRLTKSFDGKRKALDSLDIDVTAERLCFLGHNGSGKTTALSIIAGLLRPTSGSLEINGFEPYREREKALRSFSFIFEKPRLS
ncbi:hypothetical protein GCM10007108_15780 [Thermogymnomonas acidicola]|uniref:ABC transporter domain-containing protein n=1 Tax=Thermogymnomonas acidicola TaxID=399579 RepID=A0AA37BSP6_9ARCH|nr:ATP-binding cassette domain-containing protein [Thermogymnomonas acidicola]GGM78460.1 hypothetical protein GCM10007108_15780 [Thermogymnomonas acidicola]